MGGGVTGGGGGLHMKHDNISGDMSFSREIGPI